MMADDQCVPLYRRHEYFIFDREDLSRIAETSLGTPETVLTKLEGRMDIYMSDRNTQVDILFWGGFSTAVVIVLLFGICCFYGCIWCLCCDDSVPNRRRKKSPLSLVFGILTAAIALLNLAMVATLIWFETNVNNQSKVHMNTTQLYITGTVIDQDVSTVERWTDLFFTAQIYRYWISIVYLGTLIALLILMSLITCFCPKNSKMPSIVMILVAVVALTLIGSVLSGTAFVYLMYLSILCFDLSRFAGCISEDTRNPLHMSLLKLCGEDVFIPLYVVTGLFMLLMLGLMLMQCFAAAFAAYVHNSNEQRGSNKRSRPPQTREGTHSPTRQPDHDLTQESQTETTMMSTDSRFHRNVSVMSEPIPRPFQFSNARAWSSTDVPRSFSHMTSFPTTSNSERIPMDIPLDIMNFPPCPEEEPPQYDEVIRRDHLYPKTVTKHTGGVVQAPPDHGITPDVPPAQEDNGGVAFDIRDNSDSDTNSETSSRD